MAKREVYESLKRFRILYGAIVFAILTTFFIYDNDLKKSFQELDFGYFLPFFGLMILAAYFFVISGKDPGYTDDHQIQNESRDIEMEPSCIANRSGVSLELENNEQNLRESFLSNKTGSSDNEFYVDDQESFDDDEDEERANNDRIDLGPHKNLDSLRNLRRSPHPLAPDQRFCEICNIHQPYRTKHCHLCEKCIHKFDHHCVWIGSCVGELNHRKFWIFLLFQTATQIWTYFIVIATLASVKVEG